MNFPKKRSDAPGKRNKSRRVFSFWPCMLLVVAAGLIVSTGSVRAQQPDVSPAARSATARSNELVEARLQQFIVTAGANGGEELKEAGSVKPGDILEYRVRYTNRSGNAVNGFTATLPLPEQLEYLPRSATPGADSVRAATADSRYAPEPLMRTVPGQTAEPVPYAEYRSLRWNLGQLPAGAVAEVAARARVVLPAQPQTVSNAPQAPPARVVWVSPAAAVAKP